jgi:hypothetical protein
MGEAQNAEWVEMISRKLLPSTAPLEATSQIEPYLVFCYRQLFVLVFSGWKRPNHRQSLGGQIEKKLRGRPYVHLTLMSLASAHYCGLVTVMLGASLSPSGPWLAPARQL